MNYRIVVDAGHGGVDSGAVSGRLQEKDFNLKAANYMYNRFRELGVPVTITRDSDVTLTRGERLDKMRSLGTDPNVIILSNHINAGGGEGAEIVYPLRSSGILAKNILEEIGKEGQIMRKAYQRRLPENPSKDYYYIMRETPNTEALLLEYGFIDNKNDQVKLENNLLNYVEAVVKAVMNYIGLPYKAKGDKLDNTYTVKKGDTLYKISQKYGITVDELIDYNNLDSTVLSIGQVLNIPNNEEEINDYETYVVVAGDTLYKIANRFNTSVSDLKEINNLTSNIISIGEELKIPSITSTPSTQTYTVQRGDSLWLIANKLGTTVDELKRINNLSTNLLQIGQVLLIP